MRLAGGGAESLGFPGPHFENCCCKDLSVEILYFDKKQIETLEQCLMVLEIMEKTS